MLLEHLQTILDAPPSDERTAKIIKLQHYERKIVRNRLYEMLCADELAAAPDNVKDHCITCGGSMEKSLKRYLTRGNFCVKCTKEVQKRLKKRGMTT